MKLVVIATMQCRTIIVSRFAVLVRLIRSTTERGLAAVLVLDHFSAILEGRQTCLHLVEFRSGHNVLVLWRQNLGDFLLCVLDAIRSRRMRSKGLRQGTWLFLFRGLDLFEEVDHCLRIVATGVEVLRSQVVGLSFKST